MNSALLAIVCSLVASLALPAVCLAAPKKVLVVTTTKGFRHSSIPTAERVIAELASNSKVFTVDYARVEPSDPQYAGADGKPDKAKEHEAISKVLAEKMSPEALKQYDGIVFANTTGDLPIPDKEALLAWIRSGKAFVGMHAATDTFPNFPGYIDMIGGQFLRHGAQAQVDALNQDEQCPMCRHLGEKWTLFDEIYEFKNFDPSKVYTVLALDKHPNDKTPGSFPLSWCRYYGEGRPVHRSPKHQAELGQAAASHAGQGRVFYTALGHREDIWDPNTPANFERKNSKSVSEAYQAHILSGIKWALGLESWVIPIQPSRID